MDDEFDLNLMKEELEELGVWNGADQCPERTCRAPCACEVVDVKVEDNMKVKKWQTMFIMADKVSPSVFRMPEQEKERHKQILDKWSGVGTEDVLDAAESSQIAKLDHEQVVEKYKKFNKFGIVEDVSDHLFSAMEQQQPSEDWIKKIHGEWEILKDGLPGTIFVRAYKPRIDLLRAVITGPNGTPYQDGLFCFDVCFPSNYPNSPSLVRYNSAISGINPNVDNSGDVYFRLPKTSVGQETQWVPGTSTVLQLLDTIQNQFLNKKPLFNDPTYAFMSGSLYGQISSMLYNKNTLIKSLKTMVYTMNKPPKNFEVLVVGHFRRRAADIIMTCDKKARLITFKRYLALCRKPLVAAFDKIGADYSGPHVDNH